MDDGDEESGRYPERMHRRRPVVVGLLACVMLGVAGCVADPAPAAPPPSASASPEYACTYPEGGDCRGPLTASEQHTTVSFIPTLTYAVPVDGWINPEDLPGNFLLLPPNQSLTGVNAGTSDYIGVYTSVVAGQFAEGSSCDVEAVPGVTATPEGIVQWMREQPELVVSEPVATSIGGLAGQRVDVRTTEGATLPSCTDLETGDQITAFLLIVGARPSDLAHSVVPGMTIRLYLLDYGGRALAIEVDDIDAAPATLHQLSTVVDGFTFSL